MDRLTSMDVFASIVANGSFAGAARQAQVSPTVVSKHVQALENWLGVKLLNRSTRRVALTEAGEAFYERCKRILIDVEDAAGMAGCGEVSLAPVAPAVAHAVYRATNKRLRAMPFAQV
jgi:DNA-binding transcriptional LysR family regulator